MKKLMTLTACALVACAAFAEVLRDEDMQKSVDNTAVQAALSADGVCIRRNEADGSLQVIARDSADYSIGTPRDIRNKTEVAEMKAKRHLLVFVESQMKAYREHAESDSDETAETAETVDNCTGEVGEIVTTLANARQAEMFQKVINESVSGTLTGVVVLKTVKIPNEGRKTSGTIQVTVGFSAKTLAAATEAHNMITDSMNQRRAIGDKPCNSPAEGAKKACNDGTDGSGNHNKPEVHINDTLF